MPTPSPLSAWETFYVIVGSSAGALTGLQFVVIALGEQTRALRSEQGLLAFGSPTIVHFCAVLLLGAVVAVPWGSVAAAGMVLALCAAAGVGYTAVVTMRALRLREYSPVLEDWLWHTVLPAAAYLGELAGGLALSAHPRGAPYALGAAALVLLFAGIHNAWDSAAYVATMSRREPASGPQPRDG